MGRLVEEKDAEIRTDGEKQSEKRRERTEV
jgi:hypothetical protein